MHFLPSDFFRFGTLFRHLHSPAFGSRPAKPSGPPSSSRKTRLPTVRKVKKKPRISARKKKFWGSIFSLVRKTRLPTVRKVKKKPRISARKKKFSRFGLRRRRLTKGKRRFFFFSKLSIRSSPWFSYFAGIICRRGKRFLAESLLSDALFLFGIRRRGLLTPLNVLSFRYERLRPLLSYKAIRVAGQVQFIPCSITPKRQKFLAFKWLFDGASSRSEHGFSLKLRAELVDLFKGRGDSLRRRRDHYAVVRSNQALLRKKGFFLLLQPFTSFHAFPPFLFPHSLWRPIRLC